jgi:hypothetical protein
MKIKMDWNCGIALISRNNSFQAGSQLENVVVAYKPGRKISAIWALSKK